MGRRQIKKSPERIFSERVRSIFKNQKRRALMSGHLLRYTADDLADLCRIALVRGCPYCGGEVTPRNMNIDHKVPLARRGGWALSNLCCCCAGCNTAKGPLDHVEFRELLQVLARWPVPARTNTLARLKIGAKYTRGWKTTPPDATPPKEEE